MRSIADVDESKLGEIQPLLPPKAHFSFYLDTEENRISCKAEVSYGEQFTAPLVKRELSEILPETFRDPDREFDAAQTVLSYFPFTEANGRYHSEKDESSIFEILTKGIDRFLSLGADKITRSTPAVPPG